MCAALVAVLVPKIALRQTSRIRRR